MTIGGIMQPIKSERLDLAYLPPSYHQQQQLQIQQRQNLQQIQQQQQQPQPRMAPQTQSLPPNQTVQVASVQEKSNTTDSEQPKIENQPDFQSIKGVFGWTLIDKVYIPYILRSDKQFVSVRVVEMKLLNRYPNFYPDDLGKQAPLTSFFITTNEAKLLNEINLQHCAGEYGKKEFSTKDLIVLLADFIKFYNLVKKTFPDAAAALEAAQQTAGWLQIKNTVTPYVKRTSEKYVPLSVIQYAAGLLTNENVSGLPPTKTECEMLNDACKAAGVEFVFSDTTTRLINVKDILKINAVDIIELPASNPLKHAIYMELPTTNNARSGDKTKSTAVSAPNKSKQQGHPYLFQPSAQLDSIRSQLQGGLNRPDGTTTRFPLPPQSGGPQNQMFPPRMMDPRMAEMYRMQYKVAMANAPPNARPTQPPPYNTLTPMLNPMMQYYMNMQNNQNARNQSPGSQASKDQRPLSNGSETSPRAQSRPSSGHMSQPGSRPSSTSRPPSSSPLGSPLGSPTGQNFPQINRPGSNAGFTPVVDGNSASAPGQPQSLLGGQALQQMQNMFAQRLAVLGMPNNQNSQQELIPKTVQLSSPNNPPPAHTQRNVYQPNANQEIPGLFSPTGSNVAPHNVAGRASNGNSAPPPPLQLMSSPPASSVSKSVSNLSSAQQVRSNVPMTQISGRDVPMVVDAVGPPMPAPRNLPLPATISTAKPPHAALVKSIEGAWLNNKSISCLLLDKPDSKGRYCLVEAVCKLYFNGCSVNEFLFALENVLNVPLLTCNETEEKAFIQYYSLPVVTLKCNKMIKFDDLEKYFPQLTYMFPSKEAIAESERDNQDLTDTCDFIGTNGLMTPEDIEASMPATLAQYVPQVGDKRPADPSLYDSASKRQRNQGADDYDDDAVIILD